MHTVPIPRVRRVLYSGSVECLVSWTAIALLGTGDLGRAIQIGSKAMGLSLAREGAKIRSPHKAMASRRFRRSGTDRPSRDSAVAKLSDPTLQHRCPLDLSLFAHDSTPIRFPCIQGRQPAGRAFEWSRARIAGCWFQPGYIAVP